MKKLMVTGLIFSCIFAEAGALKAEALKDFPHLGKYAKKAAAADVKKALKDLPKFVFTGTGYTHKSNIKEIKDLKKLDLDHKIRKFADECARKSCRQGIKLKVLSYDMELLKAKLSKPKFFSRLNMALSLFYAVDVFCTLSGKCTWLDKKEEKEDDTDNN